MRARVVLLSCWFTLCASRAHAEGGDAQQRSAALFREGVAAGKAGDYTRAEVAFRTSYSLVPSGATLRNLALTEMKLAKMIEALNHLKVAIKSPSLTAEQRAIVQQNLDDAYAATGHIVVKTNQGARVAIDGVVVEGTAPFEAPLDVSGGRRQIEARLGMQAAHAEVDALPGRIVEVNVPVDVGAQETTAASVSNTSAVGVGTGRAGPRATAEPELRGPTWWTTPHAVGVGLAAAAVVGVVLGTSFDVASQAAASDANALRASLGGGLGACVGGTSAGPCGALRDKIDTVHEDDALKLAGFAVGAAAGVGSLVLLVLVGRDAQVRTGSVRWTPIVTPGVSGVGGSF